LNVARRLFAIATSAGAAAALLVIGSAGGQWISASQVGQGIEGIWITASGATGGNAFVTFTADGSIVLTTATLIVTEADTGIHRLTSPGHGVWVRTGDREFAATWWHNRFDAQATAFLGTVRASCAIRLDAAAEAYSCEQHVDFFDSAGNPDRPSIIATTTATRMRVEAPS